MFTTLRLPSGMSLKKPFRAVPIKLGPRYRQKARQDETRTIVVTLGKAVAFGLVIAVASVVFERPMLSSWRRLTEEPAARAVREASVWYAGCDEPRAAGRAPIYAGEPGYRSGMDGDGDGIACE
ncbi:excalibur calcium-binding domain-containing protein [Sphingomonas hylomeconis]|uniref:Excalibur calcium-binding domain-containing protein n=1 Tax=Sphingomonas hylomeconis TaxID=1395958 RepID=A0ABV7STJ3_9SPHN|nr:excalibur calcium-binding domain-containing protein [Sphingomonas hylomeconis]